DIDWLLFKPIYEMRGRQPLLEDIRPGAYQDTTTTPMPSTFLQRWRAAPARERWDLLRAHVIYEVASVLQLDQSQPIDWDQGFFHMGLDSLMSLELKGRLETSLGTSLPATLTFSYPTVDSLTQYLVQEVLTSASSAEAVTHG